MCKTLASDPHNLPTVVLSIDDLYLPHDKQQELARTHPTNPLVQHRGQPSTHDIELGTSLFSALRRRASNIRIPSYDKSAFSGQGDRRDAADWQVVNNNPTEPKIEVVIFEGWCVGFRPLSEDSLKDKWNHARSESERPDRTYDGQLGKLDFDSVHFVNDALKHCDELTEFVASPTRQLVCALT